MGQPTGARSVKIAGFVDTRGFSVSLMMVEHMFIVLELRCFVAPHSSRDDAKYQEDYGSSVYF